MSRLYGTDDASPISKPLPAAQLLTPISTLQVLMQAWVRALPEPLRLLSQSYTGMNMVQAEGTDGATCLSLAGDSH